MKPPLAVYLDLDDTLTDRSAAFANWARNFLTQHRLPETRLGELLAFDDQGRLPREIFFAGLPEILGISIHQRDELVAYRAATGIPPVVDGAEQGLRELRELGAELGVLTNGLCAVQYAKLRTTGLIGWFDHVVVSGCVNHSKPSKEIFDLARGLATRGSECWMVGDHPTNDIEGAGAAGYLTAWVSHGSPNDAASALADYSAPTLRECLHEIARRYST